MTKDFFKAILTYFIYLYKYTSSLAMFQLILYTCSTINVTVCYTLYNIIVLERQNFQNILYSICHIFDRFQREDILATLLSQIEDSGSGSGIKRVPSYVAPDLAAQIRRHVTNSIRLRKGSFPCYFVTDIATFALPAEVTITL